MLMMINYYPYYINSDAYLLQLIQPGDDEYLAMVGIIIYGSEIIQLSTKISYYLESTIMNYKLFVTDPWLFSGPPG